MYDVENLEMDCADIKRVCISAPNFRLAISRLQPFGGIPSSPVIAHAS
jgi:hypothetical protein